MSCPSRLVLGWSPVVNNVVSGLDTSRRTLRVVTQAERRAASLREEGINATVGDPMDTGTYPDEVATVFVAGTDGETNRDVAHRVREHFPDALLVVYTGKHPSDELVTAVEAVADKVLNPTQAVATEVCDLSVGPNVSRVARLLRVLRSIDGPLAVVMHDNPDPDAIASALGLVRIAERVDVEAVPCYFGDVSHQENQAMVNLLDLQLRNLAPGTDMKEYGGVALVDHSRPGVNDGLSPETPIDIAVDHHPPRAPVGARCLDLRSDVGATSTLMTEYLRRLRVVPNRQLATALLFGIRVDTKDFSREVSKADFEAAAFLCPHVDHSLLDRVESPSMSQEVLETLARAIRNRKVRGDALATNVGEIRDRDALAQAADHLLGMKGVTITLVYGYMDGTAYVSGRARGTDVDLGETLRDAFGSIGSAGGHADMAGAQLNLGIISHQNIDSEEAFDDQVTSVISGQFFETLETAPSTPTYSDSDFGVEYPME